MSSVTTSPSGGWKLLNGGLKQVSVGNAREIWGVTDVNLVYRYTTSQDWMQVPGGLKCVATGADGDVWGCSPDNSIFHRVGNDWVQVPGGLAQIGVGSSQHIVGVNTTGDIWKYTGTPGKPWQQLPGKLMWVDAGADGAIWGVNAGGQIFRWNGTDKWDLIPGALDQISVGSAGNVWGKNKANENYRWNGSSWDKMSGHFKNVSVGFDGTAFGLGGNGAVYRWETTPAAPVVVNETLTVLSYNTHLFGGSTATTAAAFKGITITYEDDLRAEKIAERIRNSGADIVALQEVWKYTRQEWFVEQVRDWYPWGWYPPDSSLDPLATSGLVLLSKRPLHYCGFAKFSNLNDDDAWAKKGVLAARIYLGGKLAFAIGTSHAGTDMGGESQPNITELWKNTILADDPALMIGDLNVHKSKYEIMDRIMRNQGAYDVWTQSQNIGTAETIDLAANRLDQYFSPGSSAGDRTEGHFDRIDYAYVKPNGSASTLKPISMEVLRDWKYKSPLAGGAEMDLSDHYPIRVVLECTVDLAKARS
jgi:virginiamycin B lyase